MPQFVTVPTVFNSPVAFNVLPRRNIDKIPVAATLPNAANIEHFTSHNTGAVTIADFQNGSDGQVLSIRGDGFTTIAHNAKIKTSSGADKLLSADLVYRFTYFNGIWYEDAAGSGGGGGGLAYPYLHTGSAATQAFEVYNSHASGLGIKSRVATDTNYTFMTAESTNTHRTWQIFGDGLEQFHVAGPFATTVLGTAAAWRRGYLGGVSAHHYSSLGGGDTGSEYYISNQSSDNISGASPQWSGHSHLAWQNFGAWDGGSRHGINGYYNSTGQFLYEEDRMAAYVGFASDGSWTYHWLPPYTVSAYFAPADTTLATSNNPYTLAAGDSPYYAGQTLIFDGGSYWMRKASIMAQRKAWDFQLGVTPDRATDLPGIVTINMLAAVGLTNRVQLFVDSALRTVQSKDFTALAAGDKVLYYT